VVRQLAGGRGPRNGRGTRGRNGDVPGENSAGRGLACFSAIAPAGPLIQVLGDCQNEDRSKESIRRSPGVGQPAPRRTLALNRRRVGAASFVVLLAGRAWIFGALLVAATFLAYLPVWRAGYIWDDDTLLLQNPGIQRPNGLAQLWTSDFPLATTTLWLEWRLWGGKPLGYPSGQRAVARAQRRGACGEC